MTSLFLWDKTDPIFEWPQSVVLRHVARAFLLIRLPHLKTHKNKFKLKIKILFYLKPSFSFWFFSDLKRVPSDHWVDWAILEESIGPNQTCKQFCLGLSQLLPLMTVCPKSKLFPTLERFDEPVQVHQSLSKLKSRFSAWPVARNRPKILKNSSYKVIPNGDIDFIRAFTTFLRRDQA